MKRRKWIALLMAVLMVVSLLPMSAFAVESVPESPTQVAEKQQNQDETPVQEQKTIDESIEENEQQKQDEILNQEQKTSEEDETPAQEQTDLEEEPEEEQLSLGSSPDEQTPENENTYVAKIGDMSYPTMSDAATAWENGGGTLQLLADVEYGNSSNQRVNLRDKTDFVLDLNGFTWNAGSENSPIDVYSELTIKDSSEDKTGKIECNFESNAWVFVVYVENNATLNMESGTIHGKNGASSNKSGCIYGTGSATINISGGKIIDQTTGANGNRWAVEMNGSGSISGGKFEGAVWFASDGIVTDGKFKGAVYSDGAAINGGYYSENLAKGNVASGFKWANNTGDDAATYPFKVVPATVTALQGTGTQADPFLINNIDDLEFFRDQINAGNVTYYGSAYQGKYFALTSGIDLNGDNWTPIGNSSYSFTGHFDGKNHTISNLYVNTTNNFAGLFGYTGDQTNISIKNLTVDNANVTGNQFAGAVVGENKQYITLDNVHVTGVVKIMTTTTTAGDAGGIIGKTIGGTKVTDCSTIADANSSSFVKTSAVNKAASAGGIMGFMAGDCSADCYFVNCSVKNVDLTSYNRVGGVVGTIQKSDGQTCHKYVTNCSVENVNVTVTGPDNTNYDNRHDAQAGLIIGCSAGSTMRYLNEYSNNTYSGNCEIIYTNSTASDLIPTALYGLWSLGSTRAKETRNQTWGTIPEGDCVITYASAEETGEVLFNGTYYKIFLSAYHAEGAGQTGSSAENPFKLMTDVGYSLVVGDKIYVEGDGHIFYPRTDEEEYRVKTTDISDTVKLYELVSKYVAQIDGTKYETLAAAIEAVSGGTEDSTTIVMIDNEAIDVAGKAGVAIPRNKNIIINLNGKTIAGICSTGKGSELIFNEGILKIKDSTDIDCNGQGQGKMTYGADPTWDYEGTVSGSYSSNLITNRGTLTIESGYYLNTVIWISVHMNLGISEVFFP